MKVVEHKIVYEKLPLTEGRMIGYDYNNIQFHFRHYRDIDNVNIDEAYITDLHGNKGIKIKVNRLKDRIAILRGKEVAYFPGNGIMAELKRPEKPIEFRRFSRLKKESE